MAGNPGRASGARGRVRGMQAVGGSPRAPPRLPPARCSRCGGGARRLLDCEHTGWRPCCAECYADVHYEITEAGS